MMENIILLTTYGILGLVNVYCFQFQRTTRKIRKFSVGTALQNLEKILLPDWYYWLYFMSFARFVPLIWLMFNDWKIALISVLVIFLLKQFIPINDYDNIQRIKKELKRKIDSKVASNLDLTLYEIVLEAEKKTL